MRILLDLQACQSKGSRHRGIGRYSMSLALAMLRQGKGHEFWIALTARFPETIDPIRHVFAGLLPPEQIKVFSVPADCSAHDPANAWRCRAAEQIREDFIARLQPDVVHVSSLFEGLTDDAVTSIGALRGGFLTAVTVYDLIPLLRKDIYLTDASVRQWYYRKLQMLKNADLLLAISESARQEAMFALQLTGSHAVNISSAVDPMFKPLQQSPQDTAALIARFGLNRPFVMYTGGIDHRKNIEGLLAAYARLPQALRLQHQLAIVCSVRDEEKARLHGIAGGLGLKNDEVAFTGFVADEDLLALYNACKLFVFPSLHEGFGLPALEAMSCGVAVIGSNNSSIPEVIGRADALFDPTDTAAITGKIAQALTDNAFRAELAAHGLVQAAQFSWDASAIRALTAIETRVAQHEAAVQTPPRTTGRPRTHRKPRMAYISPLPPDQSGIADYSAELLPELGKYYDIEVISPQSEVTDPWVLANFPLRNVAWFEAHAHRYERIVYHFGNSEFHSHMFGLLHRHPGIVVLHDFFMSGILNHLDNTGGEIRNMFGQALYRSHGYPALLEERNAGREAALWKYPVNRQVLDDASGVIIHSRFSLALADKWYGQGKSADWKYISHLRALPDPADREKIRQRLGINDGDFLICSFGMIGPTKQNECLLQAVLATSPADTGKHVHLVFVGQNHPGDYGQKLLRNMAASDWGDRIKITGFASQALYRDYLVAADVAVQLRTKSRGETSGTILDCLAYGLPTIINSHGSAADIPDDVAIKLDDEFSLETLSHSLRLLQTDTMLRLQLGKRAVNYIRTAHHPESIGSQYHEAIEQFSSNGHGSAALVEALAYLGTLATPTDTDLANAAKSIARNRQAPGFPRLLIDITYMEDPRSLNCVKELLSLDIFTFRVEPFHVEKEGHALFARQQTARMLGLELPMDDTTVEFHASDFVLTFEQLNKQSRKTAIYGDAQFSELTWTANESILSDETHSHRIAAVSLEDAVKKIVVRTNGGRR
jgi:glycosyltransferase involved in cell wall biosynthesis